MSLPHHTERLVERRLAQYCQRICPPEFERQVRLGFRIDGETVTLFEIKPVYWTLGPSGLRHEPLAQFRYDSSSSTWRFLHRGPDGRWRRYRPMPFARDFLSLLRELDRDPHGIFWTRVNGKSLRWCTAKGRCAGCECRYEQILGRAAGAGLNAATASLASRRSAALPGMR